MRLSQKILLVAAFPVVFELTIFGVLWSMVERLDQARQAEAHGRAMAASINRIGTLHMERVTVLILRPFNRGQSDMLRNQARERVRDINEEVKNMERLTVGYPTEYQLCKRLNAAFEKLGAMFTTSSDTTTTRDEASRALTLMGVKEGMEEVNSIIKVLSQQSVGDLQGKQDLLLKYDNELKYALALAASLSVALALGMAAYLNRSTARRFERLTENTARLAANQSPAAPITGTDEIADIDRLCQSLYQSLVELRARERAVLDNAIDVICGIDREMRFIEVNEAACRLWGYEKDELLGMRAVEVLEEGQAETFLKAFESVQPGYKARVVELSVRTFEGKVVETEWCITCTCEDSSYYLVIHDISQRKQMERMKQEFAAMVSHDLRTPLNSVLLTLELLQQEGAAVLSGDSLTDLRAAAGNVNRLLSLVNNLLDLESMADGQMQLFKEKCRLEDLVDGAVNSVEAIGRQRAITIDRRVEPVEYIECDQERVIQVLVNLLGNALKFSPQNSRVLLRGRKQGGFYRIEVRDRGRGIPEDKIAYVFDRFYQVKGKDDRGLKGTGLGLSICKSIVELHGGKIGVFAGEDGGCVFWFTLPLMKEEA